MRKDRTILIVLSILVISLFLQYSIIFISLPERTSTVDISAKVANVKFCINHQPTINISCNNTAIVDVPYLCLITATDPEDTSFTYESEFFNETELFVIETNGLINFTRNISYIGNHTAMIIVYDRSGCSNGFDSGYLDIELININRPPYLVSPIPNQTWEKDTNLIGAFDLDDYFFDPDLDPLVYTKVSSPLDNIRVDIDPITNEVSFFPLPEWSGTEYIMFKAWDPFYANATSNNITLVVTIIPEQEPPENIGSSGGGGGGGGGAVPTCIPRWYCRPWGRCMPDNLMYRECYDLNNCSSTFGMPNTTMDCVFESTCYDGIKGPDEEGIDCGGPCPPCGNCYDEICNNNEDCTRGLTSIPDCGGPCQPCQYIEETCYDGICNNNEDCTRGLTSIPDCGGPCQTCPSVEQPLIQKAINLAFFILILIIIILGFTAKKSYPYLISFMKKRKRKLYEEKLMLETKITESILESLHKIEEMIEKKESIDKIITLFSMLARNYFKNLFDLSYEFTYQEIMDEIRSKNISPTFKSVLQNFFDRSLEIEFSGKTTSYNELIAMVSEFKNILSLTSKEPLRIKEKELKSKVKINKIDKMFIDITNAESHLRRMEINKAFEIYLKLHKEYSKLNSEEKQKLHGFISRLYEEIKLVREKFDEKTSVA